MTLAETQLYYTHYFLSFFFSFFFLQGGGVGNLLPKRALCIYEYQLISHAQIYMHSKACLRHYYFWASVSHIPVCDVKQTMALFTYVTPLIASIQVLTWVSLPSKLAGHEVRLFMTRRKVWVHIYI